MAVKEKHVGVRVSNEVYEKLQELAAKYNMTVSDVVRAMIMFALMCDQRIIVMNETKPAKVETS